MEQVIRAYGRFLLEASVLVLLVVLLFTGIMDDQGNRGIFSMMGKYVDEEEAFGDMDFKGYQRESQRSNPTIAYVGTETLYTGNYPLSAILRAVDDEGVELPIEVNSICDSLGIERTEECLVDASHIQFAGKGVYTLRVTAVDVRNRTSTCEIRIPVNRGEEAK